MRVTLMTDDTLSCLSGNAAKVLLWVGLRQRGGHWTMATRDQIACEARIGPRQAAEAVGELADAGIIERCGYQVRMVIPERGRFTWIPSNEEILLLSRRAAKVLLAVCRSLKNETRTTRMRLATIAKRIGRSTRTVQLGLNELGLSGLLDVIRTGRANYFSARRPTAATLFDAPPIAHRSRLLLRLLSCTSTMDLQRALALHADERSELVRKTRIVESDRPASLERLRLRGIAGGVAHKIASTWSLQEIQKAIRLSLVRNVRSAEKFIIAALRRGWCSV